MKEEMHDITDPRMSLTDNTEKDSKGHTLRFPTKAYTRSSVVEQAKQFVPEKIMQMEQWNANKTNFHKLLSDRDMEHSA